MSNFIKMTGANQRDLRADARGEANILARNDIIPLLKALAQFRLPAGVIREVINNLDPKTPARLTAWKSAAQTAGYPIKSRPVATWFEVASGSLNSDMPDAWGARPVVTTPGDIDTPPVTRNRKWNEFRFLQTRVVSSVTRYFCPASDGVKYFDEDKITTLEADAAIINAFSIEDLPEAGDPASPLVAPVSAPRRAAKPRRSILSKLTKKAPEVSEEVVEEKESDDG